MSELFPLLLGRFSVVMETNLISDRLCLFLVRTNILMVFLCFGVIIMTALTDYAVTTIKTCLPWRCRVYYLLFGLLRNVKYKKTCTEGLSDDKAPCCCNSLKDFLFSESEQKHTTPTRPLEKKNLGGGAGLKNVTVIPETCKQIWEETFQHLNTVRGSQTSWVLHHAWSIKPGNIRFRISFPKKSMLTIDRQQVQVSMNNGGLFFGLAWSRHVCKKKKTRKYRSTPTLREDMST